MTETSNRPHVIIPAAGLGTRMLPTSARIPKAMIPLNERPVISWILDELLGQGFTEFTIIVGHLKHLLIDYVQSCYGGREGIKLQFVEQTVLDGVASAIQLAEADVKTQGVLIVLGDTVFHHTLDLPNDRSLVMYARVQDTWRWCLVEVDAEQRVVGYLDKPDQPVDTNKALVGIYYLHDQKRFFAALREIKEKNIRIKNEFQISSALEVYAGKEPMYGYEVAKWYDCGSKDTFQESRKSLTLEPRAFNHLVIDKNTITKRSEHKEKFINEISWFVHLPKRLRAYVPAVIDYNLDPADPFITLEYCPFPTLSELYLYSNVHLDMWKKIFRNILGVVQNQLRPTHQHHHASEDWAADFRNHYVEKTFKRVEDAKQIPEMCEIFSYKNVILNGKKLIPPRVLFKRLAAVMMPEIAKEEDISLIHGDLCFSNILYDIDNQSFKLIDPRGSFGKMKLHGDFKYDLAKLYHSAVGGYDFITNDVFKLERDENRFELTLFRQPVHVKIAELFKQVLVEETGVSLDVVQFIESTLFYSMIPLHRDHPRRMMAFYCIAAEAMNEVARHVLPPQEFEALAREHETGTTE